MIQPSFAPTHRHDGQFKRLKQSLLVWRTDIFMMNIHVVFVRFVFKIPLEISIVSLGT